MRIPKLDYPVKLNLGCGEQKEYIGIDKKDCGQEIVWDLTNGIPLPDNSVEEIISSHFLEHLNNEEVTELFIEIDRVLEKGGLIKVNLPHAGEPEAFYPDHNSFWNEARVTAMCHDSYRGMWNFKVIENKKKDNQLIFELQCN